MGRNFAKAWATTSRTPPWKTVCSRWKYVGREWVGIFQDAIVEDGVAIKVEVSDGNG